MLRISLNIIRLSIAGGMSRATRDYRATFGEIGQTQTDDALGCHDLGAKQGLAGGEMFLTSVFIFFSALTKRVTPLAITASSQTMAARIMATEKQHHQSRRAIHHGQVLRSVRHPPLRRFR